MKKKLKKILKKTVEFKNYYKFKIAKLILNSSILVSIYYVFSGEFRREHKSVLAGKIKHLTELEQTAANKYLLRRNIHRLEKGLLMKPMRKVFALNYIEETVLCYKAILTDQNRVERVDLGELKWAYDVLENYFKVTETHPIIDNAKKAFQTLPTIKESNQKTKFIPYQRKLNSISVTYENLLSLAEYRRSVRWFEDTKVPREKLEKALEIATLSPTACNRQPYKFRFFDNPKDLNVITKLPMGTKGYNHNIPGMAVVIGDLSAYPYERDRHLIYIDSALAAMSFIYGLEVQGVSSCIINWPDIEKREKEISKFLNLKPFERVIMLIGYGYPDSAGKVAYSKKKDLESISEF